MREGCYYTYPPVSVARYTFIQPSELEQCRVKKLAQSFNITARVLLVESPKLYPRATALYTSDNKPEWSRCLRWVDSSSRPATSPALWGLSASVGWQSINTAISPSQTGEYNLFQSIHSFYISIHIVFSNELSFSEIVSDNSGVFYTGPTYGHTGPTYGHTGPTYGHTRPTYGHTGPTYGHTGPTYGHTGPTYGHTGPTYGHTGPTYGHTGPTYGHTGPTYGHTGQIHGPTGPIHRHTGPTHRTYRTDPQDQPKHTGSTHKTYRTDPQDQPTRHTGLTHRTNPNIQDRPTRHTGPTHRTDPWTYRTDPQTYRTDPQTYRTDTQDRPTDIQDRVIRKKATGRKMKQVEFWNSLFKWW